MTETQELTAAHTRFLADTLALVADVARLAGWVVDAKFPVPDRDDFTISAWTVYATSDATFDRLTATLGADAVLEHERHDSRFRLVRRRFGTASLAIVQGLWPVLNGESVTRGDRIAALPTRPPYDQDATT